MKFKKKEKEIKNSINNKNDLKKKAKKLERRMTAFKVVNGLCND